MKRPVINGRQKNDYLDYKNDRGKFIESFWNIVNWTEDNKRLYDLLTS